MSPVPRRHRGRRALLRALLPALLLAGTPAVAGPRVAPTSPTPRPDDWWRARHARQEAALRRGPVELVFVGDSITQGWEREGRAVWEKHYRRRRAVNLGIGGDQTGHVLWRLKHGGLKRKRPRVAVLLIGVNNAFRADHSAAAIAEGIRAVVRLLRKQLPRTKILLLGVFPAAYGPCPLRRKIAEINRRIAPLGKDEMVRFVDFGKRFIAMRGQISRDVMFDYLHLTEKGYRIWAEAMEPTLRELYGKRPPAKIAKPPPVPRKLPEPLRRRRRARPSVP